MKYSRTALRILKSRYFSVLKKCALINAGMLTAFFVSDASAVEVSDFAAFNEAIASKEVSAVEVGQDLTAGEAINGQLADDLTIDGNGNSLSTDAGVTGFATGENDSLRINAFGTAVKLFDSKPQNVSEQEKIIEITLPDGSKKYAVTGKSISGFDGAAVNKGTLSVKDTTFYQNVRTGSFGGAVYNNGGKAVFEAENGAFVENTANYGGAVANTYGTITALDGKFVKNTARASGGAVYNKYGTIDSLKGEYVGNEAEASNGGAVYNEEGEIKSIDGIFEGNVASGTGSQHNGNGGAIFNKGKTGTIEGTFKNNRAVGVRNNSSYTYGNGGAIYNYGTIDSVDATFENNAAKFYGGAIFNKDEQKIGSVAGRFTGNTAEFYGGAIDNRGTVGRIEGTFEDNSAQSVGGALYNLGSISEIEATFRNNRAKASGGAVYNQGDIKTLNGVFENNEAGSYQNGGAVLNKGTITALGGTFEGNTGHDGGAVYNDGTIGALSGVFKNNAAKMAKGAGAVYNKTGKTVTIVADVQDTEFTGNKAGSKYIALYNEGTLNFNAGSADIVVNDEIGGNKGVININDAAANSELTGGTVQFNNLVAGNNVNVYDGTLKLGSRTDDAGKETYGNFDENVNVELKGGVLSTVDETIREHTLGQLTGSGGRLSVDMDLGGEPASDTFSVSGAGGSIGFEDINLTGLPTEDGTVKVISGAAIDNLVLEDHTVYTLNDIVSFTQSQTDKGALDYVYREGEAGLYGAVKHEDGDRTYQMDADEIVVGDLGAMGGDGFSLTVNGKGNVIRAEGDGIRGITVADGQELIFKDAGITGFAGGAVINDGTFTVKAAGADSVFEGNKDGAVYNTGTMNLDAGAADIVFNDAIAGENGTVNVIGGGTVEFNNSVTGNDINLTNGTLRLGNGGNLSADTVFTAEGGTFDIGTNNVSVDTVVFKRNSRLGITVDSLREHGRLTADNINIDKGAALEVTLAQGIVNSRKPETITLLSSGNAFDDNFLTVINNNMYTFAKGENAGEYLISLSRTGSEVSAENGGTPNNAGAAGAWIDGNAFADGSAAKEVADKLAALAQNDARGLNEALTALAPEGAPAVSVLSVERNKMIFDAVSSRLSNGGTTAMPRGKEADGISRYGSYIRDYNGMPTSYYYNNAKPNVWAEMLGSDTDVGDIGQARGFDAQTYGAAFGLENFVDARSKYGIGYAYTKSDVNAFRRDIDARAHSLFAYGEHRRGDWFVNAVAAYSFADYDEDKNVAGDYYRAKYDADTLGLQLTGGRRVFWNESELVPQAGLRYNKISRDGYRDTAGQKVSAEDTDILTAVLGVKVAKNFWDCYNDAMWRPELSLAVTYDLTTGEDSPYVSLPNGAGYLVEGERLNRFGVEVGLGVMVSVSKNFETGIGYEGSFREDYTAHAGMLKLKYNF